jgi:hypothetical protein
VECAKGPKVKSILVMVIVLMDALASPPAITTVEFNSETACRKAAADIEATVTKMPANALVTAHCYEKGG